MDTVSKGTVRMLTEPNEEEGAERLMTVPMFVDCNPFSDGNWAGAVDATQKVLEPRLLQDESGVTDMMEEIAWAGTVHKDAGKLLLVYKHPSLVTRLGTLGAGDVVY